MLFLFKVDGRGRKNSKDDLNKHCNEVWEKWNKIFKCFQIFGRENRELNF